MESSFDVDGPILEHNYAVGVLEVLKLMSYEDDNFVLGKTEELGLKRNVPSLFRL